MTFATRAIARCCRASLVCAAAVLLAAGTARAAVVWSFDETSGGVAGSFSGSLNLTGATHLGHGNSAVAIHPMRGFLGASSLQFVLPLYGVTGPEQFGPGGVTSGVSIGGDLFLVNGRRDPFIGQYIGVPVGYTSGQSLAGSVLFSNATFASLGITTGSYVFRLPNDTVTLNFGVSPVPEPATWTLALAGILGLVGVRRWRATRGAGSTPVQP